MDGTRRHGRQRSLAPTGSALAALALALTIGTASHAAQGDAEGDTEAEPASADAADAPDTTPTDEADSTGPAETTTPETPDENSAPDQPDTPGAMIPRAALVDMTRAQAGVICTSEIFLGCMGFDGRECLTLSESAIDQCLMTLPPEIDPTVLDNATLEACPREIYEVAGYEEEKAQECFAEALEGS